MRPRHRAAAARTADSIDLPSCPGRSWCQHVPASAQGSSVPVSRASSRASHAPRSAPAPCDGATPQAHSARRVPVANRNRGPVACWPRSIPCPAFSSADACRYRRLTTLRLGEQSLTSGHGATVKDQSESGWLQVMLDAFWGLAGPGRTPGGRSTWTGWARPGRARPARREARTSKDMRHGPSRRFESVRPQSA